MEIIDKLDIGITDVIRIILTIILLFIAWQSTHWSVALILSLHSLTLEFIGFTLHIIVKLLEKVSSYAE